MLRHADLTHLLAHPRFLNNDYLERLETAFPDLVGQSAEHPLFVAGAPFLRAVHVWGAVRPVLDARRRSRHRRVGRAPPASTTRSSRRSRSAWCRPTRR